MPILGNLVGTSMSSRLTLSLIGHCTPRKLSPDSLYMSWSNNNNDNNNKRLIEQGFIYSTDLEIGKTFHFPRHMAWKFMFHNQAAAFSFFVTGAYHPSLTTTTVLISDKNIYSQASFL